MELPENLDHHNWYHESKHAWNNAYKNAMMSIAKSAHSDEDLDPALNLLLPFMESVYLLKRFDTTGELLLKGNWTDIHKEFFGDVLPRDYVKRLSGDFYNRIRHRGYVPQTLRNLTLPSVVEVDEELLNREIFQILRIRFQGMRERAYVTHVHKRAFLFFIIYQIDNFFNDTPIPDEFQTPVISEMDAIIAEEELPDGSW